ncbi:MAG: hypothetical protein D6736_19515 [Nitrospinota bacterium]|nr:MAG: hypothetical protein D6736_19515 [Nitrospinota bacterium]
MTQQDKERQEEQQRLEGKVFYPHTPSQLMEVIDLAFDYRGDVTIETRDGSKIEGYLFNRNPESSEPYIQLLPPDRDEEVVIPYRDIVGIAFTGADPAFGKSWEAWMKKSAEQRKAEAARLASEAARRGHL